MNSCSIAFAISVLVAACVIPAQQQTPHYQAQHSAPPSYDQKNGQAIGQANGPADPTSNNPPPTSGSTPVEYRASDQRVTVNGAAIDQKTLEQLARAGLPLPAGDYWYDKTCGAFGKWGQPTALFIMANLQLGGPLAANASNGSTGVFINGRRLTTIEVNYLASLVQRPIQPGRYWLDAMGNAGFEGGPAVVNLLQLANRSSTGGSSKFHRGWGGTYSSDGNCYYISTSSGSVMGPGC